MSSSEPWVENYPPLNDWLKKHDAQLYLQIPLNPQRNKRPKVYLNHYCINQTFFWIEVRSDGNGWNIFTPCESIRVDETLTDAEARLGLKG